MGAPEALFSGETLETNREVIARVVAFAAKVANGQNPVEGVAGSAGQDPMQSLQEDLEALAEHGVTVPSVSQLLQSLGALNN